MSEKTVIPLYLYLDERHLDWMSDRVLQYVIADLRPLILPKLKAEADLQSRPASSGKKSSVDTHRGDFYQFCYFVRSTEPHSLVIKSRRFVAAPPVVKKPAIEPKLPATRAKGKRKAPAPSPKKAPRKKQKKAQRKQLDQDDDMDDDPIEISDDDSDTYEPGEDIDSDESMPDEPIPKSVFDTQDEEEEKPKPLLRLNYQGFNISGQCLCVVVEPWPVVKGPQANAAKDNLFTRALTAAAQNAEQSRLSVAPSRPTPAPQAREETPLFLPEDDDINPVPTLQDTSNLLTMDMEDDDSDEDRQFGGMMAFSQALNSAGDYRPGATDEDDDMDGSVFFADADEVKEL